MNTLIFKTNISTQKDFMVVKTALEKSFEIKRSTIDLDDCDKVLRIETTQSKPENISNEVKKLHYSCEELED